MEQLEFLIQEFRAYRKESTDMQIKILEQATKTNGRVNSLEAQNEYLLRVSDEHNEFINKLKGRDAVLLGVALALGSLITVFLNHVLK